MISSDPLLETNQVGIPQFIAKKLFLKEKATNLNYEFLSRCIFNGTQQYPGAVFIKQGGQKISLSNTSINFRQNLANQILSNFCQTVVYRNVIDEDIVLFNRQPSLHRSSMTGHKVKILKTGQTIQMHYCNCSGYNADFDGDEMNVHVI